MEKSFTHKDFGSNVKYYRFLKNYTQEKLGEKCDLSARYISDIENGNGNAALDTIINIANVLGVEPYILLKKEKRTPLEKRVNMK